jgi:hypothetical protein
LEQLENAILGLTSEERQRLAVWFEENRQELLGDEPDELGEEQMAEVGRRRELALAHPELLEPCDGTIERAVIIGRKSRGAKRPSAFAAEQE